MSDELWCVHVQGPDSLIAQPDYDAARKRAGEWNAAIDAMGDPQENDPTIKCVAKVWPYSASAHAEDLAKHGGSPDDIC